uniref:Ovule protein n=1 Tax=Heterorhabditis bacteriophora TaxID=37862 RepID=A0A1I7W9Y5_HETBA
MLKKLVKTQDVLQLIFCDPHYFPRWGCCFYEKIDLIIIVKLTFNLNATFITKSTVQKGLLKLLLSFYNLSIIIISVKSCFYHDVIVGPGLDGC